MCVKFIHELLHLLKSKVGSEREIFEKLFMSNLFTVRVFNRNRKRNKFFTFRLLETSDLEFELWPQVLLD